MQRGNGNRKIITNYRHCNNFSDIWDGITDSLYYYAYIMLFKTNKNSSSEIFGGVASNLDALILAFDSLSFCFRSSIFTYTTYKYIHKT